MNLNLCTDMEKGKKICNELKAIRKQIADANGIEYSPAECTHKGECKGTCPKCESEVRYLESELNMRRLLGKAVVVAGLGLSVASCSCSTNSGDEVVMGEPPVMDTIHELQGDVADTACIINDHDSDSILVEGEVEAGPDDEVSLIHE